jgi:TP901 family phage tail tape measure protein
VAQLNVVINAAGAKRGAAQANRAIRSVGTTAQTTGRNMAKLQKQAGGLRAAFAGVAKQALAFGGVMASFATLKSAITTISNFETQMTRLAGVSGATGEMLQRLTNTARRLGSTTRFTATDAASGMTYLSMTGFSAAEAMESIRAGLDLATVSGMELGDAADNASNILQQFTLSASEMVDVVDGMVAVSHAANTSVPQLAQALGYAGTEAGSAGIRFQEMQAAVGVLGNVGIQATRAGTSLRQLYASLTAPTDSALRAYERLGIAVEDITPDANDLVDIVEKFADAQKRVDAGTWAESIARVADIRSTSSLKALIADVDELARLTDLAERSQGAAADFAAMLQDTLGGSMKSLQSRIESLFLSAGDQGLAKMIRDIVEGMTSLVESVDKAAPAFGLMFREIGGSFRQVVDSINGIGVSLGLFDEMTDKAFTTENVLRSFATSIAIAFGTARISMEHLTEGIRSLRLATDSWDWHELGLASSLAAYGDWDNASAAMGRFFLSVEEHGLVKSRFNPDAMVSDIKRHAEATMLAGWAASPGALEEDAGDPIAKLLARAETKRRAWQRLIQSRPQQPIDAATRKAIESRQLAERVNPFDADISSFARAAEARIQDLQSLAGANGEIAKLIRELYADGTTPAIEFVRELEKVQDLARDRVNDIDAARVKYVDAVRAIQSLKADEAIRAGTSGFADRWAALSRGADEMERFRLEATLTASVMEVAGEVSASAAAKIANAVGELERLQKMEAIRETVDQIGSTLADGFVDAALGAKSLAEAINDVGASLLSMFASVAAQHAMQELLNGIFGAFAPSPKTQLANASDAVSQAIGQATGAFAGFFAKGGVVDSPTPFGIGRSGSFGVMGEAGPEAILPLSRGPGGELGVRGGGVVVNNHFSINTPDPNGFRPHAGGIMKDAARAVHRHLR